MHVPILTDIDPNILLYNCQACLLKVVDIY